MEYRINPKRIDSSPRRRHDARVQRQSANFSRLQRLDQLVVTEHDVHTAAVAVCTELDVPVPDLRFHARRSPFTGATELPRSMWIARGEHDFVTRYEMRGRRRLRENGAIRLGRTTTLMTLAHELGHHLVNWLDPESTASHGYVWISRFDQAAEVIDGLVLESSSIGARTARSSGRHRSVR
ncbi:MAG: hypothetical protein M3092_00930 [Actinomycetia bacterium]|nr:hypothetical protein [Actinomycetes bacterium]